jgi:ribosomal protein L10
MKDFKKRLMEWKPSSPGELPDRYTDAACEYIDEEPSSPRYEGERQVVAVFTDPNTNKQFKSKPVPYNSLVSSKMARMGYKKACRLAKQQARKSLEENNVKITKNELADIILEETRAIMQENKSTGLDHAQKLTREVMRMFYDNNERDGIVSALMNAGNIDGAEKAVLARRAVDDLVDTLEGNEQQENLEEAKNCGCGQDPCITYGKIKEGNVKMKMTKSKLQQIILEEAKKAIKEGKYGITRDGRRCKCGTEGCGGAACSDDAIEEGAVPGQISGGDLVAAITLAIDEVFQDTRPDHEAAAIAYAQISNSLDEIFRQSYKASARLGKMMGGSPEEPGELGGLGLE